MIHISDMGKSLTKSYLDKLCPIGVSIYILFLANNRAAMGRPEAISGAGKLYKSILKGELQHPNPPLLVQISLDFEAVKRSIIADCDSFESFHTSKKFMLEKLAEVKEGFDSDAD